MKKASLASVFTLAALAILLTLSTAQVRATIAQTYILIGDFDGTFESVEFLNTQVGAGIFYNSGFYGENAIIANVESGHIWGGHDVFDRSGLDLPSSPFLTYNATIDPLLAPNLGEIDFHATMVGHVLAGTGLVDGGNLSLLGAGMAPLAQLWSGAVATSYSTDPESLGSFSISTESFLAPYKEFFSGNLGAKPDVINSSWGFSDSGGTSFEVRSLDGMAFAHKEVALVVAAGNKGNAPEALGALTTGFNAIAVGALGNRDETSGLYIPSTFSSVGPADFYNPQTEQTLTGVRATVHLSAPGESFALAYYGGQSGVLASVIDEPDDPLATDLYFAFNQSGTSFSAPVVSGGIALLKEASRSPFIFAGLEESRDSRVLRSVLMAGTEVTHGWDNGQVEVDGVIRTAQGLDWTTGAGSLDLERTTDIHLGETVGTDSAGNSIGLTGWDFGTVQANGYNDYFFNLAESSPVELTVSLNWMVHREFNFVEDTILDLAFSNLDLEVWRVIEGEFVDLLAISESDYNSSEFLRIVLAENDLYGLRVSHQGMAWDLTDEGVESEEYALAWGMTAIPEPTTIMFLVAFVFWVGVRQCKKQTLA